MENFNALLTLSELKTLYSNKPVGICPLYKGNIGGTKRNEATGNPVVLPEYEQLEKLAIEFLPKQAGTGDPSPENVRPITGWDSVKITVSKGDESHDYDVTFPETIYGGTVDAVTGVGSKEWLTKIEVTSKSVNILPNFENDASNLFYLYPVTNQGDVEKLLCSHLPTKPIVPTSSTDNGIFGNPTGDMIYIRLSKGIANDLQGFKSWLDAQASAGTPVQVVYKLATPKPFEISKNSIPSLGSENTFFTNGENMDIIYKERSFWG